jgi:uncharacterized membrane protein YbhN (UPF0104 family)
MVSFLSSGFKEYGASVVSESEAVPFGQHGLPPAPAAGSSGQLTRHSSGTLRFKVLAALLALGATALAMTGAQRWHIGGLWHHFAAFSTGAIAVACGAVTLQLLSQAGRLWAVSSTVMRAHWPGTLRAFAFGQVANLYLPARMGDVVKAGLLDKAAGNASGGVGRAVGVVFIADKALDVAIIALIAAVSTARSPLHVHSLLVPHGFGLALAFVLVVVIAAGLYAWRPSWFAKLRSLAASIVQGTAALASPRSLLIGLSLSVAAWSAEGLALYVLAHAAGHALGFEQCLWVLALLNLGISVPLSLANVGTFEASVVLATTAMGVPAMEALALATVHHVVQLFATCALALALWIPARWSRSAAASQPGPASCATSVA